MWLYLAAKTFPPCRYSGTMEELRAPWPGMKTEAVPKIVQLYQESAWRCEGMSLPEHARKTNKKREIAQWVRNKRNKQGSAESLEVFANNCEMEGEKLIAVEMVSVFNDRYFGQWLALRSPFRDPGCLLGCGQRVEHAPAAIQDLGQGRRWVWPLWPQLLAARPARQCSPPPALWLPAWPCPRCCLAGAAAVG